MLGRSLQHSIFFLKELRILYVIYDDNLTSTILTYYIFKIVFTHYRMNISLSIPRQNILKNAFIIYKSCIEVKNVDVLSAVEAIVNRLLR